VLLPPALTSTARTVPSLPMSSTMTRHFIRFPLVGRYPPDHTTPQV
jgi:hypothetical protein